MIKKHPCYVVLIWIMIFAQSCNLFIPRTTCSYHLRWTNLPDEYFFLRDFTPYVTKKRKDHFIAYGKMNLLKDYNYAIYYNHCNHNSKNLPYDIKIEIYSKEKSEHEKIVCKIDCSKINHGIEKFSIDSSGKYYFKVIAIEKIAVNFGIGASKIKKKE